MYTNLGYLWTLANDPSGLWSFYWKKSKKQEKNLVIPDAKPREALDCIGW